MKKFFITLLILIGLLLVGLTIFLMTFDLNNYRHFIQEKLSATLNYPVTIASMETKLSFIPKIKINAVQIKENPDAEKNIVSIPTIEASLEILPLFKREIAIQKIDIDVLALNLTELRTKTQATDSAASSATNSPKKSFKSPFTKLWLDEITIKKLLLTFDYQGQKQTVELEQFSLKELNKFHLQLTYKERQLVLDGSFGPVLKILTEKKTLPIDLKIRQGSDVFTIKGQIGELSDLSKIRLNVTLNISQPATALEKWNIKLPKSLDAPLSNKFALEGDTKVLKLSNFELTLADKDFSLTGSGEIKDFIKNPVAQMETEISLQEGNFAKRFFLKPFKIGTNLMIDKNALTLDNIDFLANRSDLKGKIILNWTNKPLKITADLTSAYLDLNNVIAPKPITSEVKSESVATATVEAQNIQWNILKAFDLDSQLYIENFSFGNAVSDYATLKTKPTLSRGMLKMPIQAKVLSGDIEAQINLNADQQQAQMVLKANTLNLDKIKEISKHIQNANLNTNIQLTSQGNNVSELMAHTNGKIELEVLGGTIINNWFNSLPTTLDTIKQRTNSLAFSTSDKKTDVLCGAVNVDIKDGVLYSKENIALQTTALNLVLKGWVDFNRRTLDMSMIPSFNQIDKINKFVYLAQILHVSGPWNNVSINLDAQKVVQDMLEQLVNPNTKTSTLNNALCYKALGRPMSVLTSTKAPEEKPAITKTPVPAVKKDLKQELLRSLTEALSSGTIQ